MLPIPAEMCRSISHYTQLSYMALQVWLTSPSAPGKDHHTSTLLVALSSPAVWASLATKLLLQQLLRWLEKPQSAFYVPGASLKSCLWDSAGLSSSTRGAEPGQTDALCPHHMRTSLVQQSPWWGHRLVASQSPPHSGSAGCLPERRPDSTRGGTAQGGSRSAPWPCVQLPTDCHVEQGAIFFARLYFELPALIFPAFWDVIKLLSQDF